MSDTQHTYIAIDLKSFYASAECMDRGLDPLTTHLVVADASRTEKTICLAVSPSLRSYGIPGRVRLFEVIQKVREINAERRAKAPERTFSGESSCETALQADPSLALSYLVAPPRMAYYMEFSTRIYHVYPELFTAIDSQKKSALTCFYHDISEEKLKPLSTKGRKNPLGYQLACFWDCQSSPVTGFIYYS